MRNEKDRSEVVERRSEEIVFFRAGAEVVHLSRIRWGMANIPYGQVDILSRLALLQLWPTLIADAAPSIVVFVRQNLPKVTKRHRVSRCRYRHHLSVDQVHNKKISA